ncbi:uncharacterized protein BO97DRAFT_2933 [Aspergillus homomorphus CBS 101889]|uniref:Uncharacterized protein n=1 Tax=Aspergillus homomorphus (strain CBS 101889) TaxID=1450537 RepID=A0A395IAG3_ASPHC|nr:hypothetical protein BO97DRAFT_2933 [Aspergillus homomorphus CBS 101889]RAL17250.1 hypothetical protein BO97DRAFT_2933 [Aspergillus homomorphus CBS 101889]
MADRSPRHAPIPLFVSTLAIPADHSSRWPFSLLLPARLAHTQIHVVNLSSARVLQLILQILSLSQIMARLPDVGLVSLLLPSCCRKLAHRTRGRSSRRHRPSLFSLARPGHRHDNLEVHCRHGYFGRVRELFSHGLRSFWAYFYRSQSIVHQIVTIKAQRLRAAPPLSTPVGAESRNCPINPSQD